MRVNNKAKCESYKDERKNARRGYRKARTLRIIGSPDSGSEKPTAQKESKEETSVVVYY